MAVTFAYLTACTPITPSPVERPACIKATGDTSRVALSPDGSYLAVLTRQGVHLYREDTFQEVWFAPYQAHAVDVAFAADGTLIAAKFSVGGFKSKVIVWDAETGQALRTWEDDYPMSDTTGITFSPDGSMLASGRGFNTVALWDVHTGSLRREVGYWDDKVGLTWGSFGPVEWNVAWSPDGNRLAWGSFDGRVIVWDMERDELLYLLKGHQDWVWDLAFSPDGSKLATRESATIILWDMASGERLHILSYQPMQWRGSLAWSLDGTMLAASVDSEKKTVTLWDVRTGSQLCILEGHTDTVLDRVAFNSEKAVLVSASKNEIIEWDVETCEQLHTVEVCSIAGG